MSPLLINLFHVIIVAALLHSLGTNTYPEQYKYVIVYLSYFIVVYHLYKIIKRKQIKMSMNADK